MTDWLLRKSAPGVIIPLGENSFTLWSRSRPRFRRGDHVVLADGYGNHLAFSKMSTISTVETPEPPQPGEPAATKVAVDEWKPLRAGTTLELLEFSLTCVRNFERPYLHFRRAYRKLPESDTKTISDGEPFVVRTAYHRFLLSLSPELRESFERDFKDRSGESLDRASLETRFRVLVGFIDERVLSLGRLLQRISSLISESALLRQVDGKALRHEFAVDGSGTARGYLTPRNDDIVTQARLFGELENLIGGPAAERTVSPMESTEARMLQRIEVTRELPEQRRLAELFNHD